MRSRKLNITPRVIVTHVESLIFFINYRQNLQKDLQKNNCTQI